MMSTDPKVVLDAPSSEHRTQMRSMAKGFAWSGAGIWSTQLLTWGATFLIARMLTPSDYALVGMATIFSGFISEISGFLGWTVINLKDLTEEQIAQMNMLALLMGSLGFVAACAVAHTLGILFRMPALPPVILAMSVLLILAGIKVVPAALLQRDLQFKTMAAIDVAAYTTFAVSTVVFALMGFGYWSVVLGMVLLQVVYVVLVLSKRRHNFAWPETRSLRYPIKFGCHLAITGVAWYIYSNSDSFAAQRMLGQSALGTYSLALALANAPINKVASLILRVAPSFYAAAHHDKAALRAYLMTLTQVSFAVILPLTVGLAIVADPLLPMVLGAKWQPAVTPLRILLGYASVRAFTNILGPLLNAKRQAHFVMWMSIGAAICFPFGFAMASHWGTAGIAGAWLVLYPCLTLPLLQRTFKEIELSWTQFLPALWPAFSSSAMMALAVFMVRSLLAGSSPYLAVAAQIAAGVLAYAASLLLLHSKLLRSAYNTLRRAEPACA
jgi:O-antigen/teichoic acid export membrane protein